MTRPVLPLRRLRSTTRSQRAAGRGEDGFILLESIVAISLITVILAALGGMTLRSVTATNQLRARDAAVQVATSTMAVVDSLPATDLLYKRDKTTSDTQWAAVTSTNAPTYNAQVAAGLGSMTEAYDSSAVAPAGTNAAIPTGTQTQILNNVPFSVNTYLGSCVIPTSTSTCVVSGAAGVSYLRAVVAVTWGGAGCSGAGTTCTYVTSTLVNADADPVFNTNKATPPTSPVVTDPGNQLDTVTSNVSLQLAVKTNTGIPPYVWSVTAGALPAGLTMSTTGLISGSPTTAQPATSLTVTVTDGFGRTGTDTFTWAVVNPPSVTTPATQNTVRGRAVNLAVASSCPNSPCTFTMTNAPAGLTINATTGVITGTPTAAGTFANVTVTITDADSVSTASSPFTWRVTSTPPSTGDPGTIGVTVGKTYSIPIPYTCPVATCTITLNGGFPGATLASTDSASTGSTTFITTPGDVDTTGLTNLSLGKPATESSYAFGGDPARAVDGNTDGVYNDNSVSHTDTQAQPWWQVDLGAASLVRAVKIWNRTDCCDTRLSNFYVFTSQSNMSTKTAAQLLADPTVTVQRVAGLAGQPSITIPDQSAARYVRVQLSGTDYLSLAEVQVLGSVDTGTSITVGASSGTVYATGTLPAGAVTSGTSRLYTPNLVITDSSGTSSTSATGAWTAYTPPTVNSLGTRTMSVRSSPNVAIPYTCPHVSCTLTLAGTVPQGLGLSASSGVTTTNSRTTLTVTAASGTVYVNGLIDSQALPALSSSKVYSPTLTITDSDSIAATATGSWTVNKSPAITNPGTQAVQQGQTVSLQMTAVCPNNLTSTCASWSATAQLGSDPTLYPVTISSSGKITYAGAPAGTYTIRVTVTDVLNQTDTTSFTLVVGSLSANVPDQTTNKPGSGTTTVTLDASQYVNPTAGYTYVLTGAPSWLTVDARTGLLTATIGTGSATGSSITITATSTASPTSTATDTFAWTLR